MPIRTSKQIKMVAIRTSNPFSKSMPIIPARMMPAKTSFAKSQQKSLPLIYSFFFVELLINLPFLFIMYHYYAAKLINTFLSSKSFVGKMTGGAERSIF